MDTNNQKPPELKNCAGNRWISLQECADLKDLNYSTIWRAYKDKRLVTRQIGDNVKKQVLCDPTTYHPAQERKKKQA